MLFPQPSYILTLTSAFSLHLSPVTPYLSVEPLVGTCTGDILHVPQNSLALVYLHSIPCWDLTSCPPHPPLQLPNASGMHLRNVLREEEFSGKGTWRGVLLLLIKHDRKGSGLSDPDRKQVVSTPSPRVLVLCHCWSQLNVQFLDFLHTQLVV